MDQTKSGDKGGMGMMQNCPGCDIKPGHPLHQDSKHKVVQHTHPANSPTPKHPMSQPQTPQNNMRSGY